MKFSPPLSDSVSIVDRQHVRAAVDVIAFLPPKINGDRDLSNSCLVGDREIHFGGVAASAGESDGPKSDLMHDSSSIVGVDNRDGKGPAASRKRAAGCPVFETAGAA